ncbi:hypothetical protein LIA77_01318 [Sarocladium implicatum]|nr:hypothetical protein LIA77_01318 [Sarocladium implicatum]
MCVQTVRRHVCRHCFAEWTHADGLELCPEGDKIVLKHGYCAPVVEILERQGHHVSVGRVVLFAGYHDQQQQQQQQGTPQYHHHPHLQHHQQQQQQQTNGINAVQGGVGESGGGMMEDMCEDCKEKHFRQWEVEMREKQEELERKHLQHHAM